MNVLIKKTYLKRVYDKILSLLNLNRQIHQIKQQNDRTLDELETVKFLLNKLLVHNNLHIDYTNQIQQAEFKIFSQWGDDGIIQYIVNTIDFKTKTFVEFGVENYKESILDFF